MKLQVKLRPTLFLAFAVVALVPVLTLSIWLQNTAYAKAVEQVKEKHLLLAKHLTFTLDRYILDIEHILDTALHEHSAISSKNEPHFDEFMTLFYRMGVQMIAQVESEATTRIIFGKAQHQPKIGFEAIKQKPINPITQTNEVLISQLSFNQNDVPTIYILFDKTKEGQHNHAEKGSFYIIALSTDFIIELQKSINFGIKGHAAIVDASGHVIAHPKAEWQQSIKKIAGLKPVSEMLKGNSGVSQFYSPAIEADMISGYSTVKKTGWGVMVPQPISELKQEARNSWFNGLTIAVLGLLIASLIAWSLANFLTLPIQFVLNAIKGLARGETAQAPPDFFHGVKIKEADELLRSFHKTAIDIHEATEELESRVEERTSELQEEINERKKIEEKIRHVATHDELTGLPNRALLIDRLKLSLSQAKRNNTLTALLFLDLDKFKPVNDSYGHAIGDALLEIVAQRIQKSIRATDTAARYAGDEFVVLLNEVTGIDDVEHLAKKILTNLSRPYSINSLTLNISSSIGGILVPAHTSLSQDTIIQQADTLMYVSKEQGGNTVNLRSFINT